MLDWVLNKPLGIQVNQSTRFYLLGTLILNGLPRKYPNLVRTQFEIIFDPKYLVRILFERWLSCFVSTYLYGAFDCMIL